MRTGKKLPFWGIAVLYLLSCNGEKTAAPENYTKIVIDNTNIEASKDLSDLVDTVQLIQLKEKKGNYIGDIFKLYIVNGQYVVYDRLNTNKVNLFDSSGSLIKTVMKVGDGPDDGLNITDCWINNKHELEVYDYAQMKITRFDSAFNPAGFIKAKTFYHFTSVKSLPASDKYVSYSVFNEYNPPFKGQLYHFARLNNDLNVELTDKYFKKLFQGISWLQLREHFLPYDDTLRFVESYDNYVYNISNTGLVKRFKMIYKKDPLPDNVLPLVNDHLKEFKDMTVDPNQLATYLKNYTRFDGRWLENKDYVVVYSRDQTGEIGMPFCSLVDKRTNQALFNARELNVKKRYGLTLPALHFYDQQQNVFMGWLNGEQLNNAIEEQSKFKKDLNTDPETLYLVKVKLKSNS